MLAERGKNCQSVYAPMNVYDTDDVSENNLEYFQRHVSKAPQGVSRLYSEHKKVNVHMRWEPWQIL